MGLFGFGDTPQIPQAKVPGEYAGAFQRGQDFGYTDLEEARRVGQQQADLAAALRAQSEGKAPSLAAMQYAQALNQSQAAAASQLASARGLSPAQAQQLLMTRQAAAQQQAAGQSAQLRLQEQLAAQGMLGNLLGQQRQGSILGASTAGQFGATAGGLAEQARQIDQQRAIEQYRADQAQRGRAEKGIATTVGTLGGALVGSMLGPAGTTAGAALGANIGSQIGGAFAKGGEIAGRAQYAGDTRSNDTVPALLSPGEIVLPRSVAQDEDAPVKAKKFVEAIKGKKKPTPKDYTQALARLKELESRMDAMETLADLDAENEG